MQLGADEAARYVYVLMETSQLFQDHVTEAILDKLGTVFEMM